MKEKIDIKSLALGAVLGAVITFSIAATTGGGRTAREYRVVPAKVLQSELEKAINASVAEGWEFVSASPLDNKHWGFAVLRREKK
jgi:hypothetical protein